MKNDSFFLNLLATVRVLATPATRLLLFALVAWVVVPAAHRAEAQTINERIQPIWRDANQFTFQRTLPDGKSETVLVDASSGELKVAAENDRQATSGKLSGGQVFHSLSASGDIEVVFENRLDHAVDLYWVDRAGNLDKYEALAAGKTHRQHTYIGHAWLVQDADGNFFGSSIASVNNQVFRIEQEYPRPASRSRRESRFQYESPDQRYRVKWEIERHDAKQVFLLESSARQGFRARLRSRGYRLPGDRMDQYELVVTHVNSDNRVEVDLPVFDFGRPHTRWLNEHTLLIEKIDRGHQRFRLFSVDLQKNQTKVLIDEQTDHFIWTAQGLPVRVLTYLEGSSEAIYSSERSGWRHLYLVDLTGNKPLRPITQGEWLVRRILNINEESRTLDLMIGGYYADQDPYQQHLARVHFDGSRFVPITDGNGDHVIQFSPDGRFVVDSYSRVDLPPVHELRRAADGSLITGLMQAKRPGKPDSQPRLPTLFHAPGRDGKTEIWGLIAFPPDYDPQESKKYPIIESIYAGPQDSHVPKRYREAAPHRKWTEAGFIVVQIDGMGTANRSKAFHNVCWHNLKDAGFPDRIAWLKAAAQEYPALDLSRVGVFGVSAGGQNACGAVLFHGEFYQAAVASCGCHDNRMDKRSWNEQWMGYPVGPHYAQNSNIDNAHRLQGHLLLIVGELDQNVPPASTYRLVDALINSNKDFDFLMVPGAGHGDGGWYGRRKTLEFFQRHLQ